MFFEAYLEISLLVGYLKTQNVYTECFLCALILNMHKRLFWACKSISSLDPTNSCTSSSAYSDEAVSIFESRQTAESIGGRERKTETLGGRSAANQQGYPGISRKKPEHRGASYYACICRK